MFIFIKLFMNNYFYYLFRQFNKYKSNIIYNLYKCTGTFKRLNTKLNN